MEHKKHRNQFREREFFVGNLLVRVHVIIVMVRGAGLAPWEFEFSFPGRLTSTFLAAGCAPGCSRPVDQSNPIVLKTNQ